ncbi:MAG: hypothetical protein II695_09345 [Oscillospiraceae bacterium]|nr:hypothetical protein [Oscillospiraceae bacterium]
MDIKAKIEEIVNKAKSDPEFLNSLKEDPVKTLESVTGLDLPDDQVKAVAETLKDKLGSEVDTAKIVEAVQAKLGENAVSGFISGIFGKK